MEININNSDDKDYRYKMERISITLGGSGNGLKTTINNIDTIANAINTPIEVLIKYLINYLSSNYNDKTKSFTGHHDVNKIQNAIFQYINTFVICSTCKIPELTYYVDNTDKKNKIKSKCSACGNFNILNLKNKFDNKGFEIISKYLETKEWIIVEGKMVVDDDF
jgi:translation initiation factor 5